MLVVVAYLVISFLLIVLRFGDASCDEIKRPLQSARSLAAVLLCDGRPFDSVLCTYIVVIFKIRTADLAFSLKLCNVSVVVNF